jgi:hypothetical protein
MAIEILIQKEIPNSLRTKSVTALLRDNIVVKRIEKVMPLQANALAVITAEADTLIQGGQTLPLAAWLAAKEIPLRDYYYTIIMQAYQTMMSGGDIDMARGAAMLAIQQNPAKLAEFNRLREVVGLNNMVETIEDKRSDLLWMGVFAVLGIISGGV